ncbi:MAG: transcription termination factor Rho [Solirubrobacterales bacterium]|jgi:transcription termination factor Rho|nr:transcription termination factor Rho [Solirubrobacterales bacterium]
MAAELNDLHLADLHERAAAAGVAGYRLMRREELVAALGETPADEPDAEPEATEDEPEAEARPRRGRRRGRRAKPEPEPEPDTDELVVVEATVLDDSEDKPVEGGDPQPTEDVTGVLELTRQRYGFLRLNGLAPSDGDVYISAAQVRRCELRPGDEVAGPAREPRRGERHRALVHVDTVNGEEPQTEVRPEFDSLPAVLPERRISLDAFADDVLARAVDLLAPLAYGQRILIRAAARSGRTTLLRSLARAAAAADTAKVIVLLVDERPEEATAWREAVPVAEFAIATADLASIEQVRTAELALERARRLAETGTDAILVCDSLSRLAFAAGDVAEVKRLFGSGRNLVGGGSLTVIATVLEDASDEGGEAERAVITTESSLVVLDPELAAAGVTPALRPGECRVSNEDQIREPAELTAIRTLRSLLADLRPSDAAALLRERIEGTSSNSELLKSL